MKPRSSRRYDTSRVRPDLAADTLTQRRLIMRLLNMHKPTEMPHDAAIPLAWHVAILGASPAAMANCNEISPSGLALSVSKKPTPPFAQLGFRAYHPASRSAANSCRATSSPRAGLLVKNAAGNRPSRSECGEYNQNGRLHPPRSSSLGRIERSPATSGLTLLCGTNWNAG
jgi:hypothetical protein